MDSAAFKILEAAVERIRQAKKPQPRIGLILGSGLGHIADAVEGAVRIPTSEIPGYPASTVAGHDGVIVIGRLGGVDALLVRGRIHGYEGHASSIAALPARILCRSGVQVLVVTNAAGGINRDFQPGDLMLLTDHLNLTGQSPLFGRNLDELGPRFPDMSVVYPPALRNALRSVPGAEKLRQGIYACVNGPQYETPAEIRMLRILGADAVGMSTVPEAIVASHMRVPVLGISLITNLAAGMSGQRLSHEEVLEQAKKSGLLLGDLLVRAAPAIAASA